MKYFIYTVKNSREKLTHTTINHIFVQYCTEPITFCIMLLRLKVKNFLSFYEEVVFDMFPNPKRTTLEHHVYRDMEVPLLKQAALYGPNASGKSNLLKAADFIRNFAEDENFISKKVGNIKDVKFALIEKNENPICISIEFLVDKNYLIYEIEINDNGVEKEALYISGIGKEPDKTIFERCRKEISTGTKISKDIKEAVDKMITDNPLSSILSLNNRFPIIKDNKAKLAHKWFSLDSIVLSVNRDIPRLVSMLAEDEDLLSFTSHLISNIGIGAGEIEIEEKNIVDLSFEDEELYKRLTTYYDMKVRDGKTDGFSVTKNKKIYISVEKKDEELLVRRLIFKQLGINDYIGKLGLDQQSDGTARLLDLIPALYDIVNRPGVCFIDEIEHSIHPTLAFALLKYLANTQTKGQLIYTTHQTKLMDQKELLRPDEIWITEKHNGNSILYSLNEFKEHNSINLENGYLDGRYGGIPEINDLGS